MSLKSYKTHKTLKNNTKHTEYDLNLNRHRLIKQFLYSEISTLGSWYRTEQNRFYLPNELTNNKEKKEDINGRLPEGQTAHQSWPP